MTLYNILFVGQRGKRKTQRPNYNKTLTAALGPKECVRALRTAFSSLVVCASFFSHLNTTAKSTIARTNAAGNTATETNVAGNFTVNNIRGGGLGPVAADPSEDRRLHDLNFIRCANFVAQERHVQK